MSSKSRLHSIGRSSLLCRIFTWIYWLIVIAGIFCTVSGYLCYTYQHGPFSPDSQWSLDRKETQLKSWFSIEGALTEEVLASQNFLTFSQNVTNLDMSYLESLPNIQHLTLENPKLITSESMKYIAGLKNLTALVISDEGNIITDEYMEILKTSESLEIVVLNYCNCITNKGFGYLSQLPNLKHLNLYVCHRITPRGIDYLCANAPFLKTLNIYYCDNIHNDTYEHLCSAYKECTFDYLDYPEDDENKSTTVNTDYYVDLSIKNNTDMCNKVQYIVAFVMFCGFLLYSPLKRIPRGAKRFSYARFHDFFVSFGLSLSLLISAALMTFFLVVIYIYMSCPVVEMESSPFQVFIKCLAGDTDASVDINGVAYLTDSFGAADIGTQSEECDINTLNEPASGTALVSYGVRLIFVLVMIYTIAIIVPITEELFYRGVFQAFIENCFRRMYKGRIIPCGRIFLALSPIVSIGITVPMFALLHAQPIDGGMIVPYHMVMIYLLILMGLESTAFLVFWFIYMQGVRNVNFWSIIYNRNAFWSNVKTGLFSCCGILFTALIIQYLLIDFSPQWTESMGNFSVLFVPVCLIPFSFAVSYLFWRTRNLTASITLHMTYNFMVISPIIAEILLA